MGDIGRSKCSAYASKKLIRRMALDVLSNHRHQDGEVFMDGVDFYKVKAIHPHWRGFFTAFDGR